MDMTTAIFKLVGTMPDDIERLITWVMGLRLILDTYLANTTSMLSWPLLPSVRIFRILCISSGLVGLRKNDDDVRFFKYSSKEVEECNCGTSIYKVIIKPTRHSQGIYNSIIIVNKIWLHIREKMSIQKIVNLPCLLAIIIGSIKFTIIGNLADRQTSWL